MLLLLQQTMPREVAGLAFDARNALPHDSSKVAAQQLWLNLQLNTAAV